MMQNQYFVLAYYIFTPIEDPQGEVARHKAFFEGRDIRCRVYISHQGINGQMSASAADGEAYMQWLRSDQRFAGVEFKIHLHHEQVFPRATVKFRKQLVAIDREVDPSKTSAHLSPAEWKQMLEENDQNTVVIDVRNDYEWKLGHFEGAALPSLDTFRRFPEYAEALKQERDPAKTRVMMYCTGGIRCELYSGVMKELGFETVYQLDGGVINYGLREGKTHWKGKLFVFDDRLAVPISGEEAEILGQCAHCQQPSDTYYNCANMDCNELFLCCPACAEKLSGCCCTECIGAPRLRSYHRGEERPKPFKRNLSQEPTKNDRGIGSCSQQV